MAIQVKSEVGTLKRVLLHRPGQEIEQMVPGELSTLLFDDIPYLKTAQKEHDAFAELLRSNGVEVVYLENLMAETLRQHPEIRQSFIREFIHEGGPGAIAAEDRLMELFNCITDSRTLVDKTMSGVLYEEIGYGTDTPLTDLVRSRSRCVLDPIPNLYFTRDPFTSVGKGICCNHMYTTTRRRETIYGEYIMRFHDDFAGKVKQYYDRDSLFSIEGGDILNLGAEVIAVGLSQRTSPEAIEILAKNIFRNDASSIRTVLALDIPALRAYMHLDTVLTQVDVDKFTVFPGILGSLRIYAITPGERKESLHVEELHASLEDVLKKYLHQDSIRLIQCGGTNGIASAREQWNDASNTLAIAPGKVIVYDRNNITNNILRQEGIEVLEIASSELSRGRGGPRCMSMPLWREEL